MKPSATGVCRSRSWLGSDAENVAVDCRMFGAHQSGRPSGGTPHTPKDLSHGSEARSRSPSPSPTSTPPRPSTWLQTRPRHTPQRGHAGRADDAARLGLFGRDRRDSAARRPAGSVKGVQLVVEDIDAVRRGVRWPRHRRQRRATARTRGLSRLALPSSSRTRTAEHVGRPAEALVNATGIEHDLGVACCGP